MLFGDLPAAHHLGGFGLCQWTENPPLESDVDSLDLIHAACPFLPKKRKIAVKLPVSLKVRVGKKSAGQGLATPPSPPSEPLRPALPPAG